MIMMFSNDLLGRSGDSRRRELLRHLCCHASMGFLSRSLLQHSIEFGVDAVLVRACLGWRWGRRSRRWLRLQVLYQPF
jgi:hypothetical protein